MAGITPATYVQQFNNALSRLGVKAYWNPADPDAGVIAPGDVTSWGVAPDHFVQDGQFTPKFQSAKALAHDLILDRHAEQVPAEVRQKARADLAERRVQIQLTHVKADEHSRAERNMVRHILAAGEHIRRLHLLQRDPYNLVHEERVMGLGDPLAVELFANNHGPYTEMFETGASVLTGIGPRNPGAHLYPAGFTPDRFQELFKANNGSDLTSPFVAVEMTPDGYRAVPFGIHPLFKEEAQKAAMELRHAADAAENHPVKTAQEQDGLAAFINYLRAAAAALVSDKARPWDKADELWMKIPVDFKWGLRIGADETYWDTGTGIKAHAGYHMFFGIYDDATKKMISLFRKFGFQRMENELVKLAASRAYKGREVSLNVPMKGVRTIMVEGEGRHSHGSVAGFSLPNWGPYEGQAKWVINGETSDSAARRELMINVYLGDAYLGYASPEAGPSNTITHEFFHGFGPQSDTQVRDLEGRPQFNPNGTSLTVIDALTPSVMQVLEEAKASFVYTWFDTVLKSEGLIDEETRKKQMVAAVIWAFGHVMRGLYNDKGEIKTYSAVGAMIIGSFMESQALTYDEKKGTWAIDFEKAPQVAAEMFRKIVLIQATGNRAEGQKMITYYTKDEALLKLIRNDDIVERAKKHGLKPAAVQYQVLIDP
ncbi:MAG: hypothetical protein HQM16_03285 [Deltaproteobacteria bacterium]|nr:hypothetical protein [Deltaproteobacteria bacterium]